MLLLSHLSRRLWRQQIQPRLHCVPLCRRRRSRQPMQQASWCSLRPQLLRLTRRAGALLWHSRTSRSLHPSCHLPSMRRQASTPRPCRCRRRRPLPRRQQLPAGLQQSKCLGWRTMLPISCCCCPSRPWADRWRRQWQRLQPYHRLVRPPCLPPLLSRVARTRCVLRARRFLLSRHRWRLPRPARHPSLPRQTSSRCSRLLCPPPSCSLRHRQ